MKPKMIASGKGFDFWLINEEIYRAKTNSLLDIMGFPVGARFECTEVQWKKFRDLFHWAKDVEDI